MLSISIGPLALPVMPLVLLLAAWGAATLARYLAPSEFGLRAENMVWVAAGLGLLAARLAYVLQYTDAYLANPWTLVDVRDGGWSAPAGWAVASLWLAWRGGQMPMIRRALGLATLGAGLIWTAGSITVWVIQAKPAQQQLSEVMLAEFNGARTLSLPHLIAGKPVVVNLWASWCGPCRQEMPMLAAAQQHETVVGFLFVNQGESDSAVRAYLTDQGLALREVLLDRGSKLGPAVGSRGLPTTLFYDARGRLVDAHFGVLNAAALESRLRDLRTTR